MIVNGGLQPGIYFNLNAKTYHDDPAISRTNIVAADDTPFTYWEQSWMNPNRKDWAAASKKQKTTSEEMDYGEAFHCQLFEPERFEKQYFVFPTEQWDHGRIMISKEDHDTIVESIKVLRDGRDSNLFLSGGVPEVTIVFDYLGMRFRVRIDYLTPVAIVDFKTTYTLFIPHLQKAFRQYGYDVQLYLYKLAVRRFKEQFLNGEAHVYGKVNEKWFEKFLYSTIDEMTFIFQRKTAPYPFEPLLPEDDTEQSGMDKSMRAIEVIRKNFKEYGTKPWKVSDGKLKRFSMFYGIVREN